MIEAARLKPDPTQPRKTFDQEKLAELTASVTARGIRQPIRVRLDPADGNYIIIAGERRYRAALTAGLAKMPCLLADAQASAGNEVLIDQVVENWQRAELEPVELHLALVRLRDKGGLTQEDIARELGKSKSEVSRFLSLGKVNPEILEEARVDSSGKFGRTTLEALAQVPFDTQQVLADKVRDGALSAKQVEREARRLKRQALGQRVNRAAGATRRYVVGSATVEVSFRRREATTVEVVAALERAAELAKQSELK